MRRPNALSLIVFAHLLGIQAAALAAPPDSNKIQVKLHSPSIVTPTSIEVFFSNLADSQAVIDNALKNNSSWSILIDYRPSNVSVQSVLIQGHVVVLTLSSPLAPDMISKEHQISVYFNGDPTTGVMSDEADTKQPKAISKGSNWFFPTIEFTTDKKDANFDISGSLQTSVGASPQYEWSALAKYPIEYQHSSKNQGLSYIFRAAPQFTGSASQQANADPDSLIASVTTEFYFPYTHVGMNHLPVNLLFDPIDYEFERKPEQEAVLSNGKSTLNNYLQKNANLIISGRLQVLEAWKFKRVDLPNLNISLGTEFGSALSRSVLNVNPGPGYTDNPLRAVAAADVYFNVGLPKVKQPIFNVDGHYTVRSLFHPEPFRQAGVNNGNEFYSTKARHYIAVNLSRSLAKGANLIVQYKFGSLPPTFNFLDHQVTIGFEIVLGREG